MSHLKLSRLYRRTGKTTGACLVAISEAYIRPGKVIEVYEPDCTSVKLLQHTKKTVKNMVISMGLKGFKVDIDLSVGPGNPLKRPRLTVIYTSPLTTLYKDDHNKIYEVKEF